MSSSNRMDDKPFRGNNSMAFYHTGALALPWMCQPCSRVKTLLLLCLESASLCSSNVMSKLCSNVMFSVKLSLADYIFPKTTWQYFHPTSPPELRHSQGRGGTDFLSPWNWSCLCNYLNKQKEAKLARHDFEVRLKGFLLGPLSFFGTQVLGTKLLFCEEAQATRRERPCHV